MENYLIGLCTSHVKVGGDRMPDVFAIGDIEIPVLCCARRKFYVFVRSAGFVLFLRSAL